MPKAFTLDSDTNVSSPRPTVIVFGAPNREMVIRLNGTKVATGMTDTSGIFRYVPTTDIPASAAFQITDTVSGLVSSVTYAYSASATQKSIVVESALLYPSGVSRYGVLVGYGKPYTVVDVYDRDNDTVSIGTFSIDSYGRFEYAVTSESFPSGLLKLVNRATTETKYVELATDKGSCTTAGTCRIGIFDVGFSAGNVLLVRGYTPPTELNSNALYVYSRSYGTPASSNELIGVVHDADGLFTFESNSAFSNGTYIITLVRTDSTDYPTTYVLSTTDRIRPMLLREFS